jgi:hypothetical protein
MRTRDNIFRAKRDLTGNFPGLPAVFPDTMAPVVHTAPDGERELSMGRWGFPPPPNLGKMHALPARGGKTDQFRKRRLVSFPLSLARARNRQYRKIDQEHSSRGPALSRINPTQPLVLNPISHLVRGQLGKSKWILRPLSENIFEPVSCFPAIFADPKQFLINLARRHCGDALPSRGRRGLRAGPKFNKLAVRRNNMALAARPLGATLRAIFGARRHQIAA